ncbi:MAG: fibronectin type III domain-containing protein, partial [Anaerolineae bacterium]|nr:fibronectin type III domain-containing protein [Anaerolineae bacterium]
MYNKTLKLFVSVSVAALALALLLATVNSTGNSPYQPVMALDLNPALAITQPLTLPFHIYLPAVLRTYDPACTGEAPVLMWATSEEAVLLRWRYSCGCGGAATFNVYRERQLLTADIARITDEATALAILGPDWAWLTARYPEVTTVAELYAMLDDNPLLADHLVNTHYRVALVLGWGYLDETTIPGATYEYRVEVVHSDGTQLLSPISITAGQITPLDPPANLQAVTVISPALQVSFDWARAQQNRKADRKIYLAWDVPGGQGVEGWPATWNASYDVFRADSARGPYTRINVQPDGEDRPVLPMPATTPTTTTTYLEYDYFYLDADPALAYGETYYYRVAARDLLGQPRRWPTDTVQFSDYISTVPVDTLPPATPQGLTATPLTASIVLTWTPLIVDSTGYRLYRSTNMTASVTVATCSAAPETCWSQIGETAQSVFTDADVITYTVYWYRVRAVDAAGNLSAWSEPAYGKVYDRIPPCAPHVTVEGTQIIVETCPEAPDVAWHLLYCSFDGGPEMMITTVPTATGGIHVDLREYYSPPYPLAPACRVQSVDQSGNRSTLVTAPVGLLCPTDPITPITPIIMDITTVPGGVYDWTAQVQWATEPSPFLQEFRIYRYSEGESPVIYTAAPDASRYLDAEVKPNQVYSYVVGAVQNAYTCASQSIPEVEVTSQPRLYEVKPPLDCCPREQFDLVWDPSSGFRPGEGTYLQWHNPLRPGQEFMLAIIYRGLSADGDYVAITPAFSTQLHYLDADAAHPFYWYVVVMLDMATGEVIAKTPPWSPATAAQATDAVVVAVGDRPERGGRRAARLWPLLEDDANAPPAIQTPLAQWQGLPVADTFIFGNQPDTNYGGYAYIVEGFQSDTLNPAIVALVRFDLSAIPNGATINAATFGAYLETAGGVESVTVGLATVTSPWEEMTVTANSAPAVGAEAATQTIGSALNTWYTWDVTSLVQEWHAGLADNYGFALYGGPPSHSRRFSSREGAQP